MFKKIVLCFILLASAVPVFAADVHLFGNGWLDPSVNTELNTDFIANTVGVDAIVNYAATDDTTAVIVDKFATAVIPATDTVVFSIGLEDKVAGITARNTRKNVNALEQLVGDKKVVLSCPVTPYIFNNIVCHKRFNAPTIINVRTRILAIDALHEDTGIPNADGFYVFNVAVAHAWSDVNEAGRVPVDTVLLQDLLDRHPELTRTQKCTVKQIVGLACR